jgi:hypothetical protein
MTYDQLYLLHVKLNSIRMRMRLDEKPFSEEFNKQVEQLLQECLLQAKQINFVEQADCLESIYHFWMMESLGINVKMAKPFPRELIIPKEHLTTIAKHEVQNYIRDLIRNAPSSAPVTHSSGRASRPIDYIEDYNQDSRNSDLSNLILEPVENV